MHILRTNTIQDHLSPRHVSLRAVVQAVAALPFQAKGQGSGKVDIQGGPHPERMGGSRSMTWCLVQTRCTDSPLTQLQLQERARCLNLFFKPATVRETLTHVSEEGRPVGDTNCCGINRHREEGGVLWSRKQPHLNAHVVSDKLKQMGRQIF